MYINHSFVFLIILFSYGTKFTFASPEDSACRLNFTTFPYQPVGGCGNVNEQLQNWNGFPKSTCCQNALISFSHALALRAIEDPQRNIFINQNEWNTCRGSFKLQPQVSVQSCGFGDFYYGSGTCSTLQLSDVDPNVINQCSLFDSSSFDDACRNCTDAIWKGLVNMVKGLNVDENDTEKGLCLVALIISVVASQINGTSGNDDFDKCLPALLLPAPVNYIKISYSVAAKAFLAVILVLVGIIAIIVSIKCVKKNRKPMKKTSYIESCSSLYRFSKAEIKSAINYSQERKFLGRGSAGHVYRGTLPSGQLVAIKQMYRTNNTSDLFKMEIEKLSRYRHPNLVSIIGFCIEDGEQYIVYEYCSNGNLAQNLFNAGKDTALTWELRVKILRDCALALKYLHGHSDGCIFHRNFKLTNIFLTKDMNPKLSDFGLEKLLGIDENKLLNYAGIIDYRTYMDLLNPTSGSDIYCFGIVCLQLLSGQNVIDCDLDARNQLIAKAKAVNMSKRPLIDFQDPRIRGDVTSVDFDLILQLAVLCVAKSTAGRPTIDLVFDELDKAWKNTLAEMIARK